MEEVKDVQNVDFSYNSIAEISPMKDLTKLIKLNVSNNKIKNMAVFAMEDAFPNLQWLDISNNKF